MSGALSNEAVAAQWSAIRTRLMEFKYIDRDIALEICDCDRLGARIYDLRHKFGMSIRTEYRTKKNRFGHTVRYAVYVPEKEA